MGITYKMRVDPDYFRTTIDRYYRQRPFVLWLPVQYGMLALFFLVAWFGLGKADTSWAQIATIVFASVICAVALVYLTKWLILQRLSGHARLGEEFTIVVSPQGVSAAVDHVRSVWDWAAYPRSARFSDGILLLRKGVIRWLPDSAIQNGTPNEATDIVAANTSLRHIVD